MINYSGFYIATPTSVDKSAYTGISFWARFSGAEVYVRSAKANWSWSMFCNFNFNFLIFKVFCKNHF